jgi:CHAT domain-containing protein
MTTNGRVASSLVVLGLLLGLMAPSIEAHAAGSAQESASQASEGSECIPAIEQGQRLYESGSLQEALAQFESSLQACRDSSDLPGQAEAWKRIAQTQRALGHYPMAASAQEQELEIRLDLGDRLGQGNALLNLGVTYSLMSEYAPAIERTHAALDLYRAIDDREGELIALLNLGRYLHAKGDYGASVEGLHDALRLAQELADQEREAVTFEALGVTFDHLNEPIQAADAYASSARIRAAVGDVEGQAEDLLWAGGLYKQALRYESAVEAFQGWLSLEISGALPSVQAQVLSNLGVCHQALGDPETALEYTTPALAKYKLMADRAGESQELHNLGVIHQDMERYDQARRYYQEALGLSRAIGDDPGEARVLRSLSQLHLILGEDEGALEVSRESHAISRVAGDDRGTILSLSLIGRAQEAMGESELALAAFAVALNLNRELPGRDVTDKLQEGKLLSLLGNSYMSLERWIDGNVTYQQALQIALDAQDPRLEADARRNIGYAMANYGPPVSALEAFSEALELERALGYRRQEAEILYALGRLYEATWDHYQEHGVSPLTTLFNLPFEGSAEKAVEYYLESLDVRESIRSEIKLEEYKSALAAQDAEVYQKAIDLLIELGRYNEAFDLSERSRARSFLNAMANALPGLRDGVEGDLLEREQQLLQEITTLEDDLLNSALDLSDARSGSPGVVAREELAAKQREYAELLTQIKLANPELATLVSVSTMDLASIQAALAPDTTLVSYYVLEESVAAFVVSHEALSVVELPGTAEAYRQAAEDFRTLGIANLANPHPVSLVELYQGLITPILPYLNTTRLGIIAHQWLHYIPYAALSDGERYLGERFTVYDLPSVSMLQFLEAGAGESGASPVVFGNPATDNPELASLKFAADEAESVAELLGVDAVIGSEASESALQSRAGNASIIHLAAHGSFDPQAPLFSRIWLAPSDEADGRLNVHEVYGLDLGRAELVVLSACQTNLGELSAGDDIVGLNRAFLYSTPTVISSLWSVDDEATGVLMDAFYANLLDGMGKADALQAAQAALRTNASHPEWAHPYYWAAFVVSGDPGPVSSDPGSAGGSAGLGIRAAPALLALGGAALAGGAGYVALRTIKRRRALKGGGERKAGDGSNGI